MSKKSKIKRIKRCAIAFVLLGFAFLLFKFTEVKADASLITLSSKGTAVVENDGHGSITVNCNGDGQCKIHVDPN